MKKTLHNCPQEIRPQLISYLKHLEQKGIKAIYRGTNPGVDAPVEIPPDEAIPGAETSEMSETNESPREDVDVSKAAVADKLNELEAVVSKCTECGLHEGRTRTVFGKGNPRTRVMFIGEGPGREEDLQGVPFVGRSGQLLTKMIAAIDLTRDDVYITNIVKCRPPNNRDPQEPEVRCCEKYLIDQIAIIKPRIICALGRVSAHWLLQTNEPLGALRNADNSYHGTPVLVTYHPAALLRNPNFKRGAWEDFKKLRTIISDD